MSSALRAKQERERREALMEQNGARISTSPISTTPPSPPPLWSLQAEINADKRIEEAQYRQPEATLRCPLRIIPEKRVVSRMRWYYEKKELRSSPSIQTGLDQESEARYRREGARFIIDIGSSMNLSLTTMATGVVYFHRFFMVHTFQDFPRYPTALGCLFLAGKVEETPKKCRDMLKVARDILADDKWATFGPDNPTKCQEEIMTLERIILQTIKFDLHVEHPYTFLLKYAKCLKGDKARLQKMVQMAWTFVNDSLCTTLCLQWEPEIVAIALMHLAGKLSKFEVVDWIGRSSDHYRWWDMFVDDMTIELLEDICHQVLDLYSQTQVAAQANSPPPPQSNNRAGNSSQPNSQPGSGGSSKASTPVAPPMPPQGPYPPNSGQPPYPGAYPVPVPPHMLPPPYVTAPPIPGYPPPVPPVRGAMPPLPGGYGPAPPLPQQYYAPPPLPPRPNQPPPPPK